MRSRPPSFYLKKKRTQKTLGSYHSGLFHTKDSDKIEWNQSSGSGRVPKPSTVFNFKATKPESPPPKSPSGTRGLSTTFKVHGRDLGTLKQKRPGTLGKAPFLLLELRFSVSTFFFFYLDVPIAVEVVDGGDAAAVAVGIVDVFDVVRAAARVAGHHRFGAVADARQRQFAVGRRLQRVHHHLRRRRSVASRLAFFQSVATAGVVDRVLIWVVPSWT